MSATFRKLFFKLEEPPLPMPQTYATGTVWPVGQGPRVFTNEYVSRLQAWNERHRKARGNP